MSDAFINCSNCVRDVKNHPCKSYCVHSTNKRSRRERSEFHLKPSIRRHYSGIESQLKASVLDEVKKEIEAKADVTRNTIKLSDVLEILNSMRKE